MRKSITIMILTICLILAMPGSVSAVVHGGGSQPIGACYDNVIAVFWRWSACYDLYQNYKISSSTLVLLDNRAGTVNKVWTDTVTLENATTWSGTLGAEIAPNITLKVGLEGIGEINGGLADKLQATFAYAYARTIRRTQTLQVIAPPGSRIKETANLYGRKYLSFAKHYIVWIESTRKDGNVYTPEYYEYVTSNY